MIILETKDLKKYYGNGETMVRALDGVNLSVEAGSFTAIVGTSGSGKSTLLHMLGGLERPTSGEVIVDGEKIFGLKEEALTIFRRRKIGFVVMITHNEEIAQMADEIIRIEDGKIAGENCRVKSQGEDVIA